MWIDAGNNAAQTIEYFKSIPNTDTRPNRELARLAKDGDEDAMASLILKNMGLIILVSLKYRNNGLDDEDLIQEGIMGFIKGIQKYEEEKGASVTSYATIWVKAAVTRAVMSKGLQVRIPACRTEAIWKYIKIKNEMSDDTGEMVTDDEVAKQMGIRPEKLKDLIGTQYNIISYDAVSEEGEDDRPMLETIETGERIEDDIINRAAGRQMLDYARSKVNDREWDILCRIYGIETEPMTLHEISEIYGLTRERIRQIGAGAIKKLKRSREMKYFQVLLGA